MQRLEDRDSLLVDACVLGHVRLCDPMNCGPPSSSVSMGLFRQEYWSGLPFPPPGDLPDPGSQPGSLALAGAFFTTSHLGSQPLIGANLDLLHWQAHSLPLAAWETAPYWYLGTIWKGVMGLLEPFLVSQKQSVEPVPFSAFEVLL